MWKLDTRLSWLLQQRYVSVRSKAIGFQIIFIHQVSQTWFAESERILSTALITMMTPASMICSSIFSPIIVGNDVSKIKYINLVYAAPSVLSLVFCILFCKTSRPTTPPTKSAQNSSSAQIYTFKIFLSSFKTVLTNKTVLGFLAFMGLLLATINVLTSQLSQIMCSVGYTSQQMGISTASFSSSGVVGGILIGFLAKKTGKQVTAFKVFYCMASIVCIALMLILREPNLLFPTMGLLMLFGFFSIGCFPLSLELAAEETFPLDPVYAETLMHFPAQFLALVLIPLCNTLTWDFIGTDDTCGEGIRPWDYTPFFYYLMAQVTVCSCATVFIINPLMKRESFEHK